MSLALYRAVTTIAAPVVRAYLARRMRAGKEDRERIGERFGIPSAARPDGALVWVHAASVGESLSMLSLIARLIQDRPAVSLLVTTGTVTSAGIMAERLPAGVLHQYLPVDRIGWVRRFLNHWRPDLVLWVESEFWPNLVSEIGARAIPAVLINARISPASFAGWRRGRGVIRRLLANFTFCLAQTGDDRDKLVALGAADVRVPGNLKFAAAALPVDDGALAAMGHQRSAHEHHRRQTVEQAELPHGVGDVEFGVRRLCRGTQRDGEPALPQPGRDVSGAPGMARHDDGEKVRVARAQPPVHVGDDVFLARVRAGGEPARPVAERAPHGVQRGVVHRQRLGGELQVARHAHIGRTERDELVAVVPGLGETEREIGQQPADDPPAAPPAGEGGG